MKKWVGGANSLVLPGDIGKNQYAWSVNCANRGGIMQTRAGYTFIQSIQGKKPQGGIIFTPKNSRPMMLLAIDGYIFAAKQPFKVFTKINGLKFTATTQLVTFQRVLKSVSLNTDGSLKIIDPVPMVVMQDGVTKAATFDGTIGKHVEAGAPTFGIPIGEFMAWTGSRLWVSKGSRVYASDLANPDTFNENTYLAGRSNFELPGDCTGLVETADQRALLIFTETTTTAFQSNIRDRALWAQTTDFQRVILPSIGCMAPRSPTNQYGLTWWMSRSGLTNLDAAMYSQHTSVVLTTDGEMMRSKRLLSPDLSGVCCATYENYLLVAVPSGGRFNEHVWAMDQSPIGQGGSGGDRAWCGIWTGTRPVSWMKASFGGRDHLYFLSYDKTAKDGTHIHVWEAFDSDRKDNMGRISCQMETAMIEGAELNQFNYAELDLVEILGTVELKVFMGGRKGPWHLIKSTVIQAEEGSIGSSIQAEITNSSILRAFKPQSRTIKTEEFTSEGRSTSIETRDIPGRDKGFQLLIEWRGRMGIKEIRIFATESASGDTGECKPSELGRHNIVTEEGVTLE